MAQRDSYEAGWLAVLGYLTSGNLYADVTAHLWFLYYLLLLYLVSAVICPVLYRLPASWRAECMGLFNLGWTGCGNDAIDHGVGETDVFVDPRRQFRIAEPREGYDG